MEQGSQYDPLDDTVTALRDYIMHQSFKRFASDFAEHIGDSRSISVVSQFAGEGKSFLIGCLAVAFTTFFQKKVIVVDTSVSTREDSCFPLLFSRITDFDPDIRIEVATPDAFSGGSGHPIEFRFKHVLTQLRKNFDIILIDTTAISELNSAKIDPVVISRNCDGALVVNSIYSLHKKIVRRLSTSLRVSGVRLAGTVFIEAPQ